MNMSRECKNNMEKVSLTNHSKEVIEDGSKSCVICIGSVGTGKSTTIQKCAQQYETPESVILGQATTECKIYASKQEVVDDESPLPTDFFGRFLWTSFQNLLWVDTPGLNNKHRDGKKIRVYNSLNVDYNQIHCITFRGNVLLFFCRF